MKTIPAGIMMTDTAADMVTTAAAEKMCGQRVKLIESSYRNFKITTPEDMDQAWAIAMELRETWDASLLQISVE